MPTTDVFTGRPEKTFFIRQRVILWPTRLSLRPKVRSDGRKMCANMLFTTAFA